eukprot:2685635-Amphidinium_carterae.1
MFLTGGSGQQRNTVGCKSIGDATKKQSPLSTCKREHRIGCTRCSIRILCTHTSCPSTLADLLQDLTGSSGVKTATTGAASCMWVSS